jgi:glutamate synthase (NADPH/NADH) small chain
VIGAVDLIERLKLAAPSEVGGAGRGSPASPVSPESGLGSGRILVVGGGNTAIDAARELAQLGAASVTLVYRRTVAEMSGYEHELESARAEGVRVLERTVPVAVDRENGRVRALRVSTTTVEPVTGAVPPRDGSSASAGGAELEALPADWIVVAIGQSRLAQTAALFPGVAVDAGGRIVVDPATGRTGNRKVYAGGDCANGGKEVVNAVAEGKAAASAILRELASREPAADDGGAPTESSHGGFDG